MKIGVRLFVQFNFFSGDLSDGLPSGFLRLSYSSALHFTDRKGRCREYDQHPVRMHGKVFSFRVSFDTFICK